MHLDLKEISMENEDFRHVIYTDPEFQLVLMSVDPKDQVGLEKHKTRTQFVYVIQGRGTSVLGDEEFNIYPGVGFIVPKNTYHNIINTSSKVPLKFFTTYSPKEHKYDERVKHNPRK